MQKTMQWFLGSVALFFAIVIGVNGVAPSQAQAGSVSTYSSTWKAAKYLMVQLTNGYTSYDPFTKKVDPVLHDARSANPVAIGVSEWQVKGTLSGGAYKESWTVPCATADNIYTRTSQMSSPQWSIGRSSTSSCTESGTDIGKKYRVLMNVPEFFTNGGVNLISLNYKITSAAVSDDQAFVNLKSQIDYHNRGGQEAFGNTVLSNNYASRECAARSTMEYAHWALATEWCLAVTGPYSFSVTSPDRGHETQAYYNRTFLNSVFMPTEWTVNGVYCEDKNDSSCK